jgi:signal transduction histidine kinase/CheY-like chemotaxis protein
VVVLDTPFRALMGRRSLMLPLGRRLERADGSFDGTIVATFLPESLRGFLKSVDVGREGAVTIFHPDGLVLFREPSAADPLGESARGNAIFETAREGRSVGLVHAPLVDGGPDVVSAYHALAQPPLIIAVSLSEREALAEWRRAAMIGALAMVLLALMVGVGFALVARHLAALAIAEAAVGRAQRMEALGQLTGGVAHDFNNVLTVVLGNAGLMRLPQVAGHALEAIDQIERAARTGADLTRRLLTFARRQSLNVETVDVNALATSLQPMIRHLVPEGIDLRLSLAAGSCRVDVDPSQFETMLMNLCTNARDAMPGGGVLAIATDRVSLDADYVRWNPESKAGDHVVVSVSDTGVGIPADAQARVFEPFFTTKEAGRGTGLGLSMVYGFVKQSGGHVNLYSEVGQGTVVRVYFPCAVDGSVERAAQPVQLAEAEPDHGVILLVEDDPTVRALAERVLRSAGYQVKTAADGPTALASAEAPPHPDLVITDVGLPGGMSGLELAAELSRRRPGLAVLLASGYSEEVVRRRAPPGTAAPPMLAKPYDRRRLLDAVRAALRRQVGQQGSSTR